jgi:hypothetical protein
MVRRELFVAMCAGAIGAAGFLAISTPAIGRAAFHRAVSQQVVEEEEVVGDDDEGEKPPVAAQAATAGEPAAATGTAAPPESPRMTKLKQLTYDRRPSAILRAWAKPAGKELDDDAEEGQAGDGNQPQVPTRPPAAAKAAANGAAEPAAGQPTAEELKALDKELKMLQRNVTLGKWGDVKTYLAGIPAAEGKEGYAQMLRSLSSPPQQQGGRGPQQGGGGNQMPEQHVFALDDILGLAAACPHKLDRPVVTQFAPLVQLAIQAGVLSQTVIARLEREAARPAEESVLSRIQCAWLMVATGMTGEIEPFLPKFDEALMNKDSESLILLARCHSAKYDRDKKPEELETAWSSLQPVLAMPDIKSKERDEALQMLIGMVPKIREGLGQAWLEQSFAKEPELGMKILAAAGTAVAQSLQRHMQNPAERLRELQVQKKVVESLLEKTPDRADQWQETVRVLALAWLREGDLTRMYDRSTMYGPRMQRDMFGNFFYYDDNNGMMSMQRQNNELRPIGSADMLEVAPGEKWLARLEPSLVPKFLALHAQLYLKVSEDEKAYPYIEKLAESQPDLARDLVHEFIRTWTRNHDLNANNRYTNPYMYIYGFEMRANGIPLTRSKQERNLDDLEGWVRRIRKLPIKDLDESLLAKAFTTCHSTAEVYRVEAIEKVFGALDALDAKTMAQLVQQMRSSLAGIWRMPAQQEQQKTQRKQKDIEAEVLRGYDVAATVCAAGLKKHPDDWRLELAQACLLLDENTYRHEIAPDSKFSELKLEALGQFRHAAELYAKEVPKLSETEQEVTAYEHWFYAGLGASDLGQIDHRSTADPRQPTLIREALAALPGEAAEKHLGMFANSLFTRMSALKPTVKFQYLKAGFEIVGDHKQAREARRVYDYYNDLVREIKLTTRLDGSVKVGHGVPFGVFVELHHTPEIERESGGFGKYLQNQTGMMFAWNYGRPLENYRDKFEEGVRAALQEHFDVVSVTFEEKDVHSRAASEVGWRVTPYAYLLLKARGPQIDKLPTLKIDLDFLDTSGYTVLPITSSPMAIDAAPDHPESRPSSKLQITQTLDERQAKDGKLVLEVKAKARGLVPPLEEIVDVRSSDFEVKSTDDQGVQVSRFDPESSEPAIISERTWMISYAGRTDLAELPRTFHFPEPNTAVSEASYLRYEDADLKAVESTVSLEQIYGQVRQTWPYFAAGGLLALVAGGLGYRAWRRRSATRDETGWKLPETLTPFNVLAILRQIDANNGFDMRTKEELATSIQSLERFYFSGTDGQQQPDLRQLTERWMARTR